jgi:hypothetical protein
MVKYDLLVYLGLVPVVAVIMFAGFVIWSTPLNVDIETRKIRMQTRSCLGFWPCWCSLQFYTSSTRAAQVRRFLIKLQR